jgi:hypothetical protein
MPLDYFHGVLSKIRAHLRNGLNRPPRPPMAIPPRKCLPLLGFRR